MRWAAVVSGGVGLQYDDYDYNHDNAHLASHIVNELSSADLANMAKKY